MGILNEQLVEPTVGEVYKAMSYVSAGQFGDVCRAHRVDLEIPVLNAIKSCPLNKWPEQVENFVKSQYNAEIRGVLGFDGDYKFHIETEPHPFVPNMTCMNFVVSQGSVGHYLCAVYAAR